MSHGIQPISTETNKDSVLSLYRLLDPEVLAQSVSSFRRLREEDPVHWDPFLHAWVVTRYADVLEVLHTFSADRTPTPETVVRHGARSLGSDRAVDGEADALHGSHRHIRRLRRLASVHLRRRECTLSNRTSRDRERLLDAVRARGEMDVIADLAEPLPGIVTAEMLGVPVERSRAAEALVGELRRDAGKFPAQPRTRTAHVADVDEMTAYFRDAVRESGDIRGKG